MQPTLFPGFDSAITSKDLLRTIRGISDQASANATPEISGSGEAEFGYSGTRILTPLPTQIACFQITSCWKRRKLPTSLGPTQGLFWTCLGRPVTYWQGDYYAAQASSSSSPASSSSCVDPTAENDAASSTASSSGACEASSAIAASFMPSSWESSSSAEQVTDQSFWARSDRNPERLFIGLASPGDRKKWQRVLYPLYGIGQWVWCFMDYQAGCWRVLHAYDNMVRFELRETLRACSNAKACIIGFGCQRCANPGSSTSSSSSASDLSSSVGGGVFCGGVKKRGTVYIYDALGIIGQAGGSAYAPAGTKGWAKWCADSQRFEVVTVSSVATQISIANICFGTFAQGDPITATVNFCTSDVVGPGDVISVTDYSGEKYNNSGAGNGWAIQVQGAWYLFDPTCPDFFSDACSAEYYN